MMMSPRVSLQFREEMWKPAAHPRFECYLEWANSQRCEKPIAASALTGLHMNARSVVNPGRIKNLCAPPSRTSAFQNPNRGRSGLGLEAQQAAIKTFCAQYGYKLDAEYREVETGKGADALLRRPELANLSFHSLWYPIVPCISDNHFASARPVASCGGWSRFPMRSLLAAVPSYAKEALEIVARAGIASRGQGRRN